MPTEIEKTIKTKEADIYNCFLAIIDNLNSNTMKYKDNKLNEKQCEYIKKSLNHILECIELFNYLKDKIMLSLANDTVNKIINEKLLHIIHTTGS